MCTLDKCGETFLFPLPDATHGVSLIVCTRVCSPFCCIRKKNRKKPNALIVFAPGGFAAPRVQNLETFVVRTFLDSETWEGLWRVLLEGIPNMIYESNKLLAGMCFLETSYTQRFVKTFRSG